MKIDFTRPGLALSALGHGTILAALILPLLWLSSPPADDSAPEAVPIETISQSDFNQIMKGEKSSKDVTKEPTTKADKVAEADEQHVLPPNPELQKEAPPPQPPKPAAPTPPVPTPPLPPPPPPPPPPPVPEPPQPPVPEPPQRPDPPPPLPPEAPTPPKSTPVKPVPPAPVPPERDPDADVVKPAPPPKPVPRPPEPPKRAEVKPPPVPPKPLPPRPVPTPPPPPKVVEKAPPTPPKVPERPAPKKPDQMAKLLERSQDDADPTPETKATPTKPVHRAAPHAKQAPPTQTAAADGTAEPSDQKAFDPTDISKILNAQPAGAPPSTGRTLSKTASRGATTGNAPKMSPSQSDALDGLLADQFKQCWSYLGLDHGRYIPEIKVSYAEDGSLQSEPQLLNRPSDPNARSLAESALRAVKQCNPLHIPAQFSPFYDQWRSRILRFDPAEMAG